MNVPPSLMDKLRDPGEKSAFGWLTFLSIPVYLLVVVWVVGSFGLGLLIIGLGLLIRYLAELFAAAHIKTNSIEVSEQQLPEVFAAAIDCCQKLGCTPPTIYVMQENIWNSFAMRLAGKNVVVLLSGALDSLLLKGDMRQVTFLVGHEIGHHAAGHLDLWHRMVEVGGWLPWVFLWYSRRRELTCDRVGLYCTGDLRSTLLAVANMTVGAQLAERVDVNQAIAQWDKHRHEVYVRYRTIYSTHPPLLWRFEEIIKSASVMGFVPQPAPATPAGTVQGQPPVG